VRHFSNGQFEKGRHLIYTVIVGDYDRLKRPLWNPKNVDYVAFTAGCSPSGSSGWTTVPLSDESPNPTVANRRMKILGADFGTRYDSVIYVDGSIQVVGSLRNDISRFLSSGCALGVFRHRDRSNPWEELAACQKIGYFSKEQFQFEENRLLPFRERQIELGLFDAGVLMKKPVHEELEALMVRWFTLFTENPVRDQLSLPIAVWENRQIVQHFEHWTDKVAPTFFRHPHERSARAVKALFLLGALCAPLFQVLLKLKRRVVAQDRLSNVR